VALHADSAALGRSVLGAIDRLIVTKTRVLAVDFKTNADVPDRPGDVPEGLLRQMGAYAEMLGAIYPGPGDRHRDPVVADGDAHGTPA
jgi:ATP-dependent helicase/nuclease subunit A